MSTKTENFVYTIFWIVIVAAVAVGLGWLYATATNSADLRKQEKGYCVAIGGERITDGKCQVGDKIVVITGLDK